MSKLPTLSNLLGLDKFNLTNSQRNDCISLWNHYGESAAIAQAKEFQTNNAIKDTAELARKYGRRTKSNP